METTLAPWTLAMALLLTITVPALARETETLPAPDAPLPIEDLLCPLSPRGVEGCITQGFHAHHRGIDISLWGGTPVPATHAGRVVYAGDGGELGNLVVIWSEGDPPTWATWYAHLSRIDVWAGQQVTCGQQIGLSGNTGKSTGAHLHYEVRHLGVPVDPLELDYAR
jgi:murein DD-endopeptidase MepM/ murein hydrolase activator NlpD